jgi:hypothetical protein
VGIFAREVEIALVAIPPGTTKGMEEAYLAQLSRQFRPEISAAPEEALEIQ